MINLFHINNYNIDTSCFKNLLHDPIVEQFEKSFSEYVGAKYACSINSATNAIFLLFLNKNVEVSVPSMIPPVVLNALVTSGNIINFTDDIEWIGGQYILHNFGDYKVIDSAQAVYKNQFADFANDKDVMFFSFYPTKPVGSIDGGMIVSNDFDKIQWLKEAVMNGMTYSDNNWDRKIKFPGYKMYMNSAQAFIANENFKKLELKKQSLVNVCNQYNDAFALNNSSHHLYRISVENRPDFISHMKKAGISCGIHYEAQHHNQIYTNKQHYCPKSDLLSKRTVSIPFHENLSQKDLDLIIKNVRLFL